MELENSSENFPQSRHYTSDLHLRDDNIEVDIQGTG
jgi:hypothetical protein